MIRSRRGFLLAGVQVGAAAVFAGIYTQNAGASPSPRVIDRAALGIAPDGDCTHAIQAAIDGMRGSGETIRVGAGVYCIDPTTSVRLRSGMTLAFDRGAIFKALPTAAGYYAVIKIFDADSVTITGGQIVGERDQHLGTKGEWGMGVDVRASSNVLIDGLLVERCWGDGVYVGSSNGSMAGACSSIVLKNVISRQNRRQGASIVACKGALVEACTFSDTQGTAPAAGLDIEPNAGLAVEDVRIVNCVAERNQGDGIHLFAQAEGASISRCSIEGGQLRGNRRYGISLVGSRDCKIEGTEIAGSAGFAILVKKSSSHCIINPGALKDNGRDPGTLATALRAMTGRPDGEVMVEEGAVAIHITTAAGHR